MRQPVCELLMSNHCFGYESNLSAALAPFHGDGHDASGLINGNAAVAVWQLRREGP